MPTFRRDVLRESARKEYEAAKDEKDPEIVSSSRVPAIFAFSGSQYITHSQRIRKCK